MGSFRSTLTSFLCVQSDITDASQLSTLGEAECLLLHLGQGPQDTPKLSPCALPHSHGVTLENHAQCVGAQSGQNPLAAFNDHAKRGKQRQSETKKEVKCNDSLFSFFLLWKYKGKGRNNR